MNDEIYFTELIDSIPPTNVSVLSKERRFNILKKSMREKNDIGREKVAETFKQLLRVVEEEYIRQMKKCIVLRDFQSCSTHEKYEELKVPIRLPSRSARYLGVIPIPKYEYDRNFQSFSSNHWSKDLKQVIVTEKLIIRSLKLLNQHFMNTNKSSLKLPYELKELISVQKSHHSTVKQNILVQWRDYFIAEIQDDLKANHFFFEAEMSNYRDSELKKVITRFEFLFQTYIRNFVKQSIDDWVEFIRSFTVPNYSKGELWRLSTTPLIIIHLNVHINKKQKKEKGKPEPPPKPDEIPDNTVVLKPSLEECADFIRSAFSKCIETTNQIKFLESELMPFLKEQVKEEDSDDDKTDNKNDDKDKKLEPEDTLYDMSTGERLGPRRGPSFKLDENFIWIKEGLAEINKLIEENIDGPTKLLEKYKEFEPIMKASKSKKVQSLFEPKQPLQVIKRELEYYDHAYYDILNASNDNEEFTLFRIVASNIKETLSDQADKMKQAILKATCDYCIKTVDYILDDYKFMKEKIGTDPQNEAILVEVREFIKDAPQRVAKNEELVKEVGRHMLMLVDYCYQYDINEMTKYWTTKTWPIEISSEITLGAMHIEKQEQVFMEKLEREKEEFIKNLRNRELALQKIKTFKDLETSRIFAQDCHTLKQQLEADARLVHEFNERESLFDLQASEYPELDACNEEFQPYYKLILSAYDIRSNFRDWMTMEFNKLPPFDEIEQTVIQNRSQCTTISKKLEEDNPEAADAALLLRDEIDEFRKHLPIIKCMSSNAIMEDDWEEIRVLIGQENLEKDDLVLEKMIQDDFAKFLPQIEEVVMRAEKKLSLRNKLKQLKDEIKDVKIELFEHKSGTYVLKGYIELFTVLDDQTVATQTMLGSQYMDPPLRKEARQWESKLKEMSDIVDEIRKCQKAWMYLEPIFSSEDIHKQLPTEGPMFLAVDQYWRSQMEMILQDPGIQDLIDRENLKSTFQSHNQRLDLIQKSLNDYLEQKRGVFPRFYFLANEDLLLILAQTKDPLAVQAHMDKCFEGIQELIFEDKHVIKGMVSAEGEKVYYEKDIDVNEGDNKGNVENWLTDVETEMRKCLQNICLESSKAYVQTTRTDWVTKWPGQIVLAISQLYWTQGVENALRVRKNTVAEVTAFEKVLQQQIEDIVIMVRGELPAQTRVTLKALVVVDVHARDVVRGLIHKNVSNKEDFDWTAQLRYYLNEKQLLEVKMVNAVINYGYEYLGNSLRLVITPLTDR